MTRPTWETPSSVDTRSPRNCRSVASNTAWRRLDAVSSGAIIRKLSGFILITSRSHVPSTATVPTGPVPGSGTSTA